MRHHTRVPLPNKAHGFTLVEILVVVTIVAILVGAVALNIDFRNVGKIVRDSATRTGLVMNLAADQAVYSRQQLGIRFHPDTYEFYILSTDDKGVATWQVLDDDRLKFKDTGIEMELQVDISGLPITLESLTEEREDATEEDPIKPHVMFLSNGEMMPDFRIILADMEGEFRYQIATGEVEPVVVESLN